MVLSEPFDLTDWSDRFSQRDSAGLAALYHEDALLYGSSDSLLSGRRAIQGYFAALPAAGAASARFSDLAVAHLSAKTVAVAGLVHFSIGDSALTMRITLTFVDEGDAWLIGMHHATVPGVLSSDRDQLEEISPAGSRSEGLAAETQKRGQ